jgi:hypothetical protein
MVWLMECGMWCQDNSARETSYRIKSVIFTMAEFVTPLVPKRKTKVNEFDLTLKDLAPRTISISVMQKRLHSTDFEAQRRPHEQC